MHNGSILLMLRNPICSFLFFSYCAVQVKVHLRWRLNLIVIISLSIHLGLMTSQDCVCIQCVTNGLEGKEI